MTTIKLRSRIEGTHIVTGVFFGEPGSPIDGVNKRLSAEVEALRVLLDTLADDIYGEGRKAVLNGFAEGARRQWWLATAGRDIAAGTGGAR